MHRLIGALLALIAAVFVAWGDPVGQSQCKRGDLGLVTDLPSILSEHAQWLSTKDTRQPAGRRADLKLKDLSGQDLKKADLREADLYGAKLVRTQFNEAKLGQANLGCIQGLGAQFSGANLFQATLADAKLTAANFKEAKLIGADLSRTELKDTNFTGADLARSKLIGARLIGTLLAESRVDHVDVREAVWQPQDAPKHGIGSLRNLASLRLDQASPNPVGMGALLKALRDAEAEKQARDLVSARGRALTGVLWLQFCADGDIGALVSGAFRYIAWELPTDYGRSSGRAALAALVLAIGMLPIYFHWGFRPGANVPGICRIEMKGGIAPRGRGMSILEDDRVKRLQPTAWHQRLLLAAWFSGLTSARLGIGSFNLVEMLRKLTRGETDLAAVGRLWWVASVQSLLSFVLLLLWFLSVTSTAEKLF